MLDRPTPESPTINAVHSWSLNLGRPFGVELRLHALFLLLLLFSITSALGQGADTARGLALWLILLSAVVLRELARSIASLAFGISLTGLTLLPTGALPTYAASGPLSPRLERRLAFVGPLTNLIAAATFAGLALSSSPALHLLQHPWISIRFLLRSLVWANLLLGLLHLLPAVPLDAGRVFRAETERDRGPATAVRASGGLSRLLSLFLVGGGLAFSSPPLGLCGCFLLLAASLDRQSHLAEGAIDSVRIRDVMLEDFHTLSGADTLEEALHRAIHASQDVFPVVRSGSLVGAVSRQGILSALEAGGNSYVQGVMTRSLVPASPDDSVLAALRRASAHTGVAQLVPVVEGDRVIGIVTPQNLSHSARLFGRLRAFRRATHRRA